LTEIYLVRHASPDWNRVDLSYYVPPGPPLTPQGEQEAEGLAAFLRESGVRRFYTSPMERCRRTAEIAAAAVGVEPLEETGLSEWQPGESEAQVRERFLPLWQRLAANGHGAEPAALVTHGGPVAMMLADLGLDSAVLAHYRKLFDRNNPMPPASAWRAARADMPEAYRKKDFLI
jgi:probable phosphoglycerate mutase